MDKGMTREHDMLSAAKHERYIHTLYPAKHKRYIQRESEQEEQYIVGHKS